jgi:hypothetical protein
MISERVLSKTASGLKDLGWDDSEIIEAIEIISSGNGKSQNIVMPTHLRDEAMLIADIACRTTYHLTRGSKEYKIKFKKVYQDYLTEAWLNSKGIEDADGLKRSNPAGIEVNVFEKLEQQYQIKDLVPNKDTLRKKAPIGIMYMGKDGYLQKIIMQLYGVLTEAPKSNDPAGLVRPQMSPENAKELIKNIVTQYSAAVTSLGNTFLYAFGNYNTKRKFSGVPIYDQVNGVLKQKRNKTETAAAKTLEFTKLSKSPTDEEKKALREVTYRQMTRQIYLYVFSSIVAGVGALDYTVIDSIEKGVAEICEKLWKNETDKDATLGKEIPLSFLLQKNVRDIVTQEFFDSYSSKITERPANSGFSIRQAYLEQIIKAIEEFPKEVQKKKYSSARSLYSKSNSAKKKSFVTP